MKRLVGLLIVVAAAGACAGGSVSPTPAPHVPWRGDTLLAPFIDVPMLTNVQLQQADSLGSRIGEELHVRLAAVVADTAAPTLVRHNALQVLAERRERNLDPYLDALEARDERLRTAALAGLRPLMAISQLAVKAVRDALRDPSHMVQIKALEVFGDLDPTVLREYAARTRDRTLNTVAMQLIMAAEDAGAQLVPKDTTGLLERVTASGHTIVFKPVRRWPNWSAAVGDLLIGARGKAPAVISADVEVVNHVIPAFIEPEGRYLVFEAGRSIYVQDLQTGDRRKAGDGIAPRLVPLSDTFLYLRPKKVQNTATGASVTYEVVQQKLTGGQLVIAGELATSTDIAVKGNYAPVRWMRVREQDGGFFLMGERMDPFRLEVLTL